MRICNQYCAACQMAHNGINGRWCKAFGMYVEYMREPLCNKERFKGTLPEYEEAEVVEC